MPHAPQLAGSEVVSVQTPLQTVRSVVQVVSKLPPSPVDESDAGAVGATAPDSGESAAGPAPTASNPQAA